MYPFLLFFIFDLVFFLVISILCSKSSMRVNDSYSHILSLLFACWVILHAFYRLLIFFFKMIIFQKTFWNFLTNPDEIHYIF